MWQALSKANDFDRAHTLLESGHTPDRYADCLWLAGCYAATSPHGEQLLLAAYSRWSPYATWDAVATEPVVQPVLRLVFTGRVREHYPFRPIGPEAEKTS